MRQEIRQELYCYLWSNRVKSYYKVKNISQNNYNSHGGDAVYGLGLIGAGVYYVSTATSFWMGCLGILKALVWPAFVVYEVMKYFVM
jgi:hypothetical protein